MHPTGQTAARQLCLAGNRALRTKNWQEASDCYRHCLEQEPDPEIRFQAHSHLGLALRELRDYAAAELQSQQALKLAPQAPNAWGNLGRLYQLWQQPLKALHCYTQALQFVMSPQQKAQLEFNRALCWLTLGDYPQGFAAYLNKSLSGDEFPLPLAAPPPRWQGQSLAGKTLLLHSNEGLGDALMLVRLLPPLQTQFGAPNAPKPRLWLCCQPPLQRLLQAHPSLEQVWSTPPLQLQTPSQTQADYFSPLYALPHYLKLQAAALPLAESYLRAPSQPLPPALQPQLNRPNLRLGLVWASNPEAPSYARRSLPLAQIRRTLQPVLAATAAPIPSVYSLQLGPARQELQSWNAEAKQPPIVDLADQLGDLADTAAYLQSLDLLISVDTAAAHLGGALGKAVWLLLPYEADWRWHLTETPEPGVTVSRWYPSLRLFRQSQPGDWSTPLQALATALRAQLCT